MGPEAAYRAVEDQFLEKRSYSANYGSAAENHEKSGLTTSFLKKEQHLVLLCSKTAKAVLTVE